jgi:hypothetical protein
MIQKQMRWERGMVAVGGRMLVDLRKEMVGWFYWRLAGRLLVNRGKLQVDCRRLEDGNI